MIELRPYQDSTDRAEVIQLWTAAFGYSAAHNAPARVIDQKLAVGDGLFFVALEAGRLAGTVMAGYDGHRGWLYSLAVQADARRSGHGRRLVRHAEAALAARGCTKVNLQLLDSNHALSAFYEQLGYCIEPRISMGRLLE